MKITHHDDKKGKYQSYEIHIQLDEKGQSYSCNGNFAVDLNGYGWDKRDATNNARAALTVLIDESRAILNLLNDETV